MNRVRALLLSSIGRKVVMAVTGLLLLGFLVVHLIGNLYVFEGREPLNGYAAWLKSNPLLWPARFALLAAFALHVWIGVSLARANRAARPVAYRRKLVEPAATRVSRSMVVTGLLVLAFVIFHLAHFTWGWILPEAHAMVDAQGRHDVYGMVRAGLGTPWIAAAYVVAMAVLALHLAHAGQSLLQTLGVRFEPSNRLVRGAAFAVVALLAAGNLALPALVFLGVGDVDASAVAQLAPRGEP